MNATYPPYVCHRCDNDDTHQWGPSAATEHRTADGRRVWLLHRQCACPHRDCECDAEIVRVHAPAEDDIPTEPLPSLTAGTRPPLPQRTARRPSATTEPREEPPREQVEQLLDGLRTLAYDEPATERPQPWFTEAPAHPGETAEDH